MYNIAIIINKNSKGAIGVERALLTKWDNIKINMYNTPSEFVTVAQNRSLSVDRFIIFPNGLGEDNSKKEDILSSFFNYIATNHPSTSVLLVSNSEPLAEMFSSIFLSPLMATLFMDKNTKASEIALLGDINLDRIKKGLGYTRLDREEDLDDSLNEEISTTPDIDPYKPKEDKKPKKEGFFKSLFKKGKKAEPEQEEAYKPVGSSSPVDSDSDSEDNINEELELSNLPKYPIAENEEEEEYSTSDDIEESLHFPETSDFGVEGLGLGLGVQPSVDVATGLDGFGELDFPVEEPYVEQKSVLDIAETVVVPPPVIEPAVMTAVADAPVLAPDIPVAPVAVASFVAPVLETPFVADSLVDKTISDIEATVTLPDLNTRGTGYDFNEGMDEIDEEEYNEEFDLTSMEDKYKEGTTVEKIVVERVEVEKVVEVEKRVEVPVEKIVVERVEVPVEKVVVQRVEVPIEVEKRVEVPVEKVVIQKVEVPVEVEKRVEVPVEVEKIVKVNVEVPVEVEKIVEVEKRVEVEKIVEVEKLVEVETFVGGGNRRTYKNGVRTIIVTGDRKTGVTGTALNLSAYYAKTGKTLYVDLDTVRKGSLLYLGIENIALANPAQISGVENLMSVNGLSHSVYAFDKRNFDCLLSSYGSVIEPQRIKDLQRLLISQRTYDTVIIDCPLENLVHLEDMVLYGEVFICMESTVPSIVVTLSSLSDMDFEDKGMSYLFNNSQFVLSKGSLESDFEKNLRYVSDIFSLEEQKLDWSSVKSLGVVDKLGSVLVNY